MASDPHETSGSVSSDGSTTSSSVSSDDSTTKLLSDGYSCSYLPDQTLTILSPNPRTTSRIQGAASVRSLLDTSMSSDMLFGDGEGIELENRSECSVHSSQQHIYQEVGPLVRADHAVSTSTIAPMYSSVRELPYARLTRKILPKSKKVPIFLCFSVGIIALSLVAIFIAQYIKSIEYVYRYENCVLCADLTEDDKISITYLRRQGDLKYCCFETERGPVSRLKKAVMKTFEPTIKEKHLQRNKSIETNGTDAAMEITLEIGEVSAHFKPDNENLPMRRLKLLSGVIQVKNDRLVIQKPGRYFVNSQFYHNIKFKKEELKPLANVVGHDIQRFNEQLPNNKTQQLMVNFYTAREYLPKTDYHVSHMAGIFKLKEDDEIFVGATNGTDTPGNRLSLIFLGDQ